MAAPRPGGCSPSRSPYRNRTATPAGHRTGSPRRSVRDRCDGLGPVPPAVRDNSPVWTVSGQAVCGPAGLARWRWQGCGVTARASAAAVRTRRRRPRRRGVSCCGTPSGPVRLCVRRSASSRARVAPTPTTGCTAWAASPHRTTRPLTQRWVRTSRRRSWNTSLGTPVPSRWSMSWPSGQARCRRGRSGTWSWDWCGR